MVIRGLWWHAIRMRDEALDYIAGNPAQDRMERPFIARKSCAEILMSHAGPHFAAKHDKGVVSVIHGSGRVSELEPE
jgi:hypothetical protein